MKSIHLFLVLVLFSFNAISQPYYVNQEYCKKKDMEFISGESIPEGYLVMQKGYFVMYGTNNSLDDLAKKQVKKMNTYCKWRHCCKVFVAFKPIEKNVGEPKITVKPDESLVQFYVLAPFWELDCN